MKRIYFIIFCLAIQGLLQGAQAWHMNEPLLYAYGKDILRKATLDTNVQKSSDLELIWNEYSELQNKLFQAYRSHLEEFVLSKKEEFRDTLFENIPLSEQKLINGAEYLLAIMHITALGGFRWPDNGVQRLEKLIKRFSANPEMFPEEFIYHFTDYCMLFLEYARIYADNLLEIDFSQALLYSLKPDKEYLAINFLNTIIYSPDEIDSGLKNKSRALLIKILIRQNNPTNMVEILNLLSSISEDTIKNAGVFPEDADYAQKIMEQIYPSM